MDADRTLALIGVALLLLVPIVTGIYNDWKRSPKRHPHPSQRCQHGRHIDKCRMCV